MIFKELSVARNSLRHESGYLKKAIMKSFIFKNKTPKSSKMQEIVKLLEWIVQKRTKQFFSNLDPVKVCDNKTFWKNIRPYFSVKKTKTKLLLLTPMKQ